MVVVGGGGGSDVKMGCTIYWKFFPPTSYLQGCPSVNLLCNSHIINNLIFIHFIFDFIPFITFL